MVSVFYSQCALEPNGGDDFDFVFWITSHVGKQNGAAGLTVLRVRRSLDFYSSTAADGRVSRAYLSGGTARVPALFKVLEARAGVPVEILNPFKNIEVDNKRFDPAVILAAAPSAAVGVGLALRRAGDK